MLNNKGSVTKSRVEKLTPEQEKYNSFLSMILSDRLFETGTALNKTLVKEFGVTDSYARVILKRATDSNAIESSWPYTFGKKQYVYLSKGQYLNAERVMDICRTARPPIFRILKYMSERGGIISYYEAMKIAATPLEESSTKVNSLGDIVKLLKKLDIISELNYKGADFLYLKDHYPVETDLDINADLAQSYSNMVLDCSLLPDILLWLKKANIVSQDGFVFRNKNTPWIGIKHNNLPWDAIGYTKTTGINDVVAANAKTKEQQTLVVVDTVLYEDYDHIHLDGFFSRVRININAVKGRNRKVLPIIIYRRCSAHVLNQIAKLGFLAFDIGSIFGSKIYHVLRSLSDIEGSLHKEGTVEGSITDILSTIRNSGQEEALKGLKGALFELLMYPLVKSIYGNAAIERNVSYKETVDQKINNYEFDYIVTSENPNEIIVIECKGYNSKSFIDAGDSTKKNTLRWFFRRGLPYLQRKLKDKISEGASIKGIFFTSANFTQDGHALLAKLNAGSFKSLNLNTGYDRSALMQLLKDYGFKSEIATIERFYTTDVDLDEGNEAF
ncbi:MAG: hypothetical protein JSS82_18425 [Bacteroidetes bacterium]|nr:hypothetical protein [Bacteroidota bacterium]